METSDLRRLQAQLKLLQRRQRAEFATLPGLSRAAVRALGVIARYTDACQPGQIGDELGMAASNVAAALRELDAAGYIVRAKAVSDSRRVMVSLTSRGSRVVEDSRSERDGWLGNAVDSLLTPSEQNVLIAAGDLIERIATSAAASEQVSSAVAS